MFTKSIPYLHKIFPNVKTDQELDENGNPFPSYRPSREFGIPVLFFRPKMIQICQLLKIHF